MGNAGGDQRSKWLRMLTISSAQLTLKHRLTRASLFAASGILVLLAGCATEPQSHVLSAPPPPAPTGKNTVVTTAAPVSTTTQTTQTTQTTADGTIVTTHTQPVSTIVVTQAPPAQQTELILAQPTAAHAWIPGYWTWRNNQYQWLAGRWEVPPHSNAKWIAPRWQTENGAYRFYEGYWN